MGEEGSLDFLTSSASLSLESDPYESNKRLIPCQVQMKLLPFLESCVKKIHKFSNDWTGRKVPEVSVNNEDTTFTLEVPELQITA